jgi:hypothetical protein
LWLCGNSVGSKAWLEAQPLDGAAVFRGRIFFSAHAKLAGKIHAWM